MSKELDLPFGEGQRIEATARHLWTVDEFEDIPLEVEPGDKGLVDEILELEDDKRVFITWDKDKFPHRKKSLSYEEALTLKVI